MKHWLKLEEGVDLENDNYLNHKYFLMVPVLRRPDCIDCEGDVHKFVSDNIALTTAQLLWYHQPMTSFTQGETKRD